MAVCSDAGADVERLIDSLPLVPQGQMLELTSALTCSRERRRDDLEMPTSMSGVHRLISSYGRLSTAPANIRRLEKVRESRS